MKKFDMTWCDSVRTHEALHEVNQKIASVFLQEPKDVRFVFLSYIANPQGRNKGTCLGMCVRDADEIQLRVGVGWQNTAVHELVHLYNPDMEEPQVEKVTKDVCKYLKVFLA